MTEEHVGRIVDGRYRLDRLLGEGASGKVYAATQLTVDRTVAVKLLHRTDESSFNERFETEAKAIGKLSHTNIITLHDFGYDKGMEAYYMVTEYADGVPLSERMADVMETDLILKIGLEIASALHHAHAQGILHRDLKPENVMLTHADGRVDVAKVLDFGLASLVKPAEETASDQIDEETAKALAARGISQDAIHTVSTPVLSSDDDDEAATTTMAAVTPDTIHDGIGTEPLGEEPATKIMSAHVLRAGAAQEKHSDE